jgi:4-hydroxy-3-methylbut-2-enyl diphosphate reductase
MKITIARSAGFCFGVKRAIKIALEAPRDNVLIEMLGDIVHNEHVAKDIKKAGIKKVTRLTSGKNKALLIRAHGVPLGTIEKAKKLAYRIIDATCPVVKGIHHIAITMEKQHRTIIIIGDKNHAEVQGIIGHLQTVPLLLDDEHALPLPRIKKIKKACAIVQSTQDLEKVERIFAVLRKHIKDLNLFNTICSTTKAKQNEIRTMPLKNDVMIIIGSKTSANTKRLFEIAKSLNKKSHWVSSGKDLRPTWFKNADTAGVTAGASTPDYTTREVISRIRQITSPSAH